MTRDELLEFKEMLYIKYAPKDRGFKGGIETNIFDQALLKYLSFKIDQDLINLNRLDEVWVKDKPGRDYSEKN